MLSISGHILCPVCREKTALKDPRDLKLNWALIHHLGLVNEKRNASKSSQPICGACCKVGPRNHIDGLPHCRHTRFFFRPMPLASARTALNGSAQISVSSVTPGNTRMEWWQSTVMCPLQRSPASHRGAPSMPRSWLCSAQSARCVCSVRVPARNALTRLRSLCASTARRKEAATTVTRQRMSVPCTTNTANVFRCVCTTLCSAIICQHLLVSLFPFYRTKWPELVTQQADLRPT